MSTLSLLGGQKNMQNPAMSTMGPSSRLSKANELQFFKMGHFIYLENSINRLKGILFYFIILLYSLSSLMKIISFCRFLPEDSWILTFSSLSRGRYSANVWGAGRNLQLCSRGRNTAGWLFQLHRNFWSQPPQVIGGKCFFFLTIVKTQSVLNGREFSFGRRNQVISDKWSLLCLCTEA